MINPLDGNHPKSDLRGAGARGNRTDSMGLIASLWGVFGVLALLGMAIFKLSAPALATFTYPLGARHWLLLFAGLTFLLYVKGYRGFQRALSPRIATRARQLRQQPTLLRTLLAPLYCMGYFAIERRKQAFVLLMTAVMVLLVFLVRQLEQPWRGIVDVGIVLALGWGFMTTLVFSAQALATATPVPLAVPQLPENRP